MLGHFAALLHAFQVSYPDIRLELIVSDAVVDPVKVGVDCALQIFPAASTELVSRPLFPVRRVFCATPAYLRKAGMPVGGVIVNLVRPQDLDQAARDELLEDAVDTKALGQTLAAAGLRAPMSLVPALIHEGRDHAERRRLEDSQRELIAKIGVPTYELPKLAGGADIGGLYELASELIEQGLA